MSNAFFKINDKQTIFIIYTSISKNNLKQNINLIVLIMLFLFK